MKEILLLLMEGLVHWKKSLILILVKQKQNLLSLHYNGDNSSLLVNRKEIYKFKADNKDDNFST